MTLKHALRYAKMPVSDGRPHPACTYSPRNKSNPFDDGRKFQRLETQIRAIEQEILYGIGKNSPSTKTNLRERLERVFTDYVNLAQQYRVSSAEVQRVSETYKRAIAD